MGRPTPVLFMSGYTGDTAIRQSLLDPGAAFLEKPFTPEVLLGRVDELLATAASRETDAH
jgi:DNA-binding response OmpR family regulator